MTQGVLNEEQKDDLHTSTNWFCSRPGHDVTIGCAMNHGTQHTIRCGDYALYPPQPPGSQVRWGTEWPKFDNVLQGNIYYEWWHLIPQQRMKDTIFPHTFWRPFRITCLGYFLDPNICGFQYICCVLSWIRDPSGQLAELIAYITSTRVDLYSHHILLLYGHGTVIPNLLDIDFSHGDIHDQSCKKCKYRSRPFKSFHSNRADINETLLISAIKPYVMFWILHTLPRHVSKKGPYSDALY